MGADGSQPQEVIRRYVETHGGRVDVHVEHLKQSFGVEELTDENVAMIERALGGAGVRRDPPLDRVGTDGRLALETRPLGAERERRGVFRRAFAASWRGEPKPAEPAPAEPARAARAGDDAPWAEPAEPQPLGSAPEPDEPAPEPEEPAPEPPEPEPRPGGGGLIFGGPHDPNYHSEVADRAGALVTDQVRAVLEAADEYAREVREAAERDAERIRSEAAVAATSILGRIDALAPPLEDLVANFRNELGELSSSLRDQGISVDLPPGEVEEEPALAEAPAEERPAADPPAGNEPGADAPQEPPPAAERPSLTPRPGSQSEPEPPPPRGLFSRLRRGSAAGPDAP